MGHLGKYNGLKINLRLGACGAWSGYPERALLGPLPQVLPKPFDLVVKRRVHHDGVIHFEGRQNNVPFHLADREVDVHGCERMIHVFADGSLLKEWPRGTSERLLIDPGCYEGESTDRVLAPSPPGRLGQGARKGSLLTLPPTGGGGLSARPRAAGS